MYQNGFVKIELSSPELYIANPFKNAKNIIDILNKSEASFVLFPELCLSTYTAGDFFFETNFLEENLKALLWIIQNNNFKGIYFIGMPFLLEESIFNVAVVIQKKKILGIVPKQTIPNYKEFNEKRWFQSGKNISTKLVTLLGQEVPIGNILFINKIFDLIFGVEICQDLWTIESPSDLLVLNGAHLIFNLSASTEHLKKNNFRKMVVLNHSRKQIGGYFYNSGGLYESPTDTLLSNHKIAAVLGQIVGEKDLLNDNTSLIVDISIDTIKYQRRIDTTYADQKIGKNFLFWQSFFDLEEVKDYQFEKTFSPRPFVDFEKEELNKQLKLANAIQILALKTKIQHFKPKQVILQIKPTLNDFLNLLVLIQSLRLIPKYFNKCTIILSKELDYNSVLIQLLKSFLNSLDIKNIIENQDFIAKNYSELKLLYLESYNLSDIALGNFIKQKKYEFLYNVNIGISNTLMVELILFHLREKIISIDDNLKKFYLNQIEFFLTPKIIQEDFVLYHYLTNKLKQDKIAFLVQKTFVLNQQESLFLVQNYMDTFYRNQNQKQQISPGPKILENSLSYRTELKLPLDFQR